MAQCARPALRLTVALLPVTLTPVFGFLIGSGRLDLGGGEKDLVWLLPWLLWSLAFAVSALVLWRRGWPVGRSTTRSAIVGLSVVVVAAVVLALFGRLGVGGRF